MKRTCLQKAQTLINNPDGYREHVSSLPAGQAGIRLEIRSAINFRSKRDSAT